MVRGLLRVRAMRARLPASLELALAALLLATAGCGGPSPESPPRAERWIDDVRVGQRLDATGEVAPFIGRPAFLRSAPIYLSMRVADVPAGSHVRVELIDASNHEVWSDEQPVAPDVEQLTFKIEGGALDLGRYEARVMVGDESAFVQPLEVMVAMA